jgi:hypothetical protein
VIEPTRAARAVRLSAIRERALDARNTSTASLDRRWLLGEVDRLSTERDQAQSQSHADLEAAVKYNADREDAGRVTSKAWDMVTALELERDELKRELGDTTERLAALTADYDRDVTA